MKTWPLFLLGRMESVDLSDRVEDLEGLAVVYPVAEQRLASNPSLFPGINCCAVCATPEHKKGEECVSCARIWYCSRKCRQQDASVHEGSLCRVLWQVRRDDEVEEQLLAMKKKQEKKQQNTKTTTKTTKKKKKQIETTQEEKKEPVQVSASHGRISSEIESYPKTLQVMLMT